MSNNELNDNCNKWNILLCLLLSLPFVAMLLIFVMAKFKLSMILGSVFVGAGIICMCTIGFAPPYSVRKDLNFTTRDICIGLLGVMFFVISIYLFKTEL